MQYATIPKDPRFEDVKKIARNFLLDEEINSLPINSFEIAKKLDIELVPYSLSKYKPLSDIDVDGAVTYWDGRIAIFYNNNITCKERINWTIMHEIGHIYLSHFKYDKTLWMSNLSEEERRVLEIEAHCFASEVLAPFAILNKLDIKDHTDIMTLCGISSSAAQRRFETINNYLYKEKYEEQDQQICSYFHAFLKPVAVCANKWQLQGFPTIPKGKISGSSHNRLNSFKKFILETKCLRTVFDENIPLWGRCGRETHLIPNGLLEKWKECTEFNSNCSYIASSS